MQRMLDAGINTRRGVMCAHREPAYPAGTWSCGAPGGCACPGGSCGRLKESEAAQDHGLILPMFEGLTDAQQDAVLQALRAATASS